MSACVKDSILRTHSINHKLIMWKHTAAQICFILCSVYYSYDFAKLTTNQPIWSLFFKSFFQPRILRNVKLKFRSENLESWLRISEPNRPVAIPLISCSCLLICAWLNHQFKSWFNPARQLLKLKRNYFQNCFLI